MWDYLKDCKKPIILYGTGDGADKVLDVMTRYGLSPVCFTASGEFGEKSFKSAKTGQTYKVFPLSQVERKYGGFVLLVCFGSDKEDVLDYVYEVAEKHEVYAPDTPVAGDGIYDSDFIEQNADKLDKVRKMFADDKSREVFDGWLDYRLSGSLDVLEQIASPRKEIISLLKLGTDEFFIDAGAFKGDTVEEFLAAVGQDIRNPKEIKFKKIIAIEPDIKNFTAMRRKLYAYGSGLIQQVHGAAWSEDTQVDFSVKTGRSGGVGEIVGVLRARKVSVKGAKIDTLCGTESKPTYIKIDVEGGEAQVLKGARTVINKHRPKMIVSLYHRREDMFEIPLLIESFNPRYKFYLRKTRCIPGWEFNLIVC